MIYCNVTAHFIRGSRYSHCICAVCSSFLCSIFYQLSELLANQQAARVSKRPMPTNHTMAKRPATTTLDVNEKRRRLDPKQWTADEVSVYLAGRCDLTPFVASSIEVRGADIDQVLKTGGFEQWMSNHPQALKNIPKRKYDEIQHALAELADPLMKKFMLYDGDSSGDLDYDEFKHLSESITGIHHTNEEFAKLTKTIDLDANGKISFAEFKHFVENDSVTPVAQSLKKSLFDQLFNIEAVTSLSLPHPSLSSLPELKKHENI
jgi:hypothetical protein